MVPETVETESIDDLFPVQPDKTSKDTKSKNTKDTKESKSTPTPNTSTTISRKVVDDKARAMAEASKLPPPPGRNVTFEKLEEWLRILTPDMWNRVKGYVYRLHPVIIRKLTNPEAYKYIDIINSDQLTSDGTYLDYVKKNHGGGKYRFWISDTDNVAPGAGKAYFEAILNIPIDDCMPVLDYKELDINSDKNLGYINILKSRGLMDGKGTPMATSPTVIQDNSGPALAQMSRDFVSTFREMSKESQSLILKLLGDKNEANNNRGTDLTPLLLEKLKQENPNNQLTMITTLITAMKEMQPKAEKDNSMEQFIKVMEMNRQSEREAAQRQHELTIKMLEKDSNANKQTNSDDSFLDKLIRYKQAIPELFGGQSVVEGKKTLAGEIIEGVKELALPAIGLVSQIFQSKTGIAPLIPTNESQANEMMQNQPMGGGAVRQPTRMINVPQTNNNPNNSTINNPGSTQTQTSPNPTQTQTPQPQQQLTQIQQVLVQFGNFIIKPIQSGMSGYELAEHFSSVGSLLGFDLFAVLNKEGLEGVITSMKSVPAFWEKTGMVVGEDRVREIMGEFIDYPNRLKEIELEEQREKEGKGNKEEEEE